MRRTQAALLSLAAAAGVCACSHGPRRFPLSPPLWQDRDQNHVPRRPADYYSGIIGDFVDHSFFRKLSQPFAAPLPGEATNVNALDEVPNSAWFENRIGLHPIGPEEAARGACAHPPLDPEKGPWVVSGAKPDGGDLLLTKNLRACCLRPARRGGLFGQARIAAARLRPR